MADENKSLEQIENIISQFSPMPSTRYYARMGKAPWQRSPNRSLTRVSAAFAFGFVMFVIILIVSFGSPLSTIAQSIASYFIGNDQPQITIHFDEMVALEQPLQLETISALKSMVDYPIRYPDEMAEGFKLSEILYRPGVESAHLVFRNSRGETIEVIQSPNVENYRRVYSLEQIEQVVIGDKIGEYSIGTWREEPADAENSPDNGLQISTIQAIWDPTLEHQALRWVDDEIIFEVRYYFLNAGEAPVMKEELILLAETLKQVNE